MIVFSFQAVIAVFSMMAGGFWLASAIGRTVEPPWRNPKPVPEEELSAHQAKWNARAAACAATAAMFQGILLLYEMGLPSTH